MQTLMRMLIGTLICYSDARRRHPPTSRVRVAALCGALADQPRRIRAQETRARRSPALAFLVALISRALARRACSLSLSHSPFSLASTFALPLPLARLDWSLLFARDAAGACSTPVDARAPHAKPV
eukprot:3719373-Pleurochrysis_carterae.AAC.1